MRRGRFPRERLRVIDPSAAGAPPGLRRVNADVPDHLPARELDRVAVDDTRRADVLRE
jgi:hypothetical protein